jgi:RNA polymerase subunit RPABC4/transcription elongation factor Spt4
MAAFIDQVVGASLSLSAQELHARLKGELERQAEQLLHRHPADLGRAEAELRRALAGRLDLLGLEMELVVAEREGLLRLELLMGSPQAPLHASCSACQSSVPAGMRFCPRCGARQEPGAEPTAERLITRDQEEVELDVVLVVGSRGRGLGEGPVRQALFAALARRLRGLAAAELEPQLDALAAALSSDLDGALAGLGLRVHQLAILDLRRRGQEWERAVRAEMARARGEAALGREWLGVEELELANQALTLALQLRREKVVGEHLLSQAELQLDQERRRAAIEAGQRELLRARQAAEHDDQVTAAQRSGQLSELAAQQQSARLRQQADDEAYADQRRREGRLAELERLAALDRQMADQDMRHRKELSEGRGAAEIIALQASELAGKTHGGDFARALAAMSQGEAVQKEREGTVLAFRRAAEQATSMAERSMDAHARVAAAAAGASAVGRACAHCGTRLGRQDAFCPECGQKS